MKCSQSKSLSLISQHITAVVSQVNTGICWHPAARLNPETLCSDIHLLHTQVPGGRGLTWAAGDRRDWQATEEEVHGGQEGLQETDGAESGASVGGEVYLIGIRAGGLEERLFLTGRAEGEEMGSMKCQNIVKNIMYWKNWIKDITFLRVSTDTVA